MRSWRTTERALVEDARQNGNMLRVTWHPEHQRFVVSHWRDNVCVAATQVDVADAGTMVGVLVDGLSSAVNHPVEAPTPPPGLLDRFLGRLRTLAA